jgi:hypothetical protein
MKLSMIAIASGICLVGLAGPASAQLMGRDGYSPPPRAESLAAQFQFQQRMQAGGAAGTEAGLGALQQYITQYTSNSTSIGNLNQTTQNVSGGSTASIGTSTQDSNGSQSSSAETKTKVDNRVKILEEAMSSGNSPSQ